MSFRSCGCFPRMRSIWLRERGQDLWTMCNIKSPGLPQWLGLSGIGICGGRDVPSSRRPTSRCRGTLRPPAGAQLHLHTSVKGFRADRQTGRLSLCRSLKSTPRRPPSALRGACSPWAEGGVVRREGDELGRSFLGHLPPHRQQSACSETFSAH